MAKLKRKTRNILSIILVTLLTFGLGFGIYSIVSTKTKTISPTIFSVGGVSNNGEYIANKTSLYNEEMFECQGLRIERDFESTVKYEIHYYDVVQKYLGSVSCSDDNYVISEPFLNARYCRVVVKPNRTKDIGYFEKYSIAKQLKITVDKDQDYVDNHNVFNYDNNNYGFTVSGSTLNFNSSNVDYDSYYLQVAETKESFAYNRMVILSTYDLNANDITAVYNVGANCPKNETAINGNAISFNDKENVKNFVTEDGYYAYVITLKNLPENSDCYVVFNTLKSQAKPQVYLYSTPSIVQ